MATAVEPVANTTTTATLASTSRKLQSRAQLSLAIIAYTEYLSPNGPSGEEKEALVVHARARYRSRFGRRPASPTQQRCILRTSPSQTQPDATPATGSGALEHHVWRQIQQQMNLSHNSQGAAGGAERRPGARRRATARTPAATNRNEWRIQIWCGAATVLCKRERGGNSRGKASPA